MGRDTLLTATLGSQTLLKKAMLVLAGSIFIAVAAQITVPMWPVPVTLQTLAILLVGFTFGSRLALATMLAYLAQGAAGLPVFAGGLNFVAFAGPTAGFLLGFVAMAWAAGLAAERGIARGVVSTALVALALSAMIYLPGLAWPMALAGGFGLEAGWVAQDAGYYWTWFVAPFLVGDALKAVIAALVVTGAWAALRKRA
ncbi:biotin transporter BioY [Roseicyclus persicicus]|uniref:Biotin transporter n=1 Tax=Roseicyclus persicicus TaxID=2650661 RepID=A0A7X6H2C6_9RHOB|nr:biotin transporter BioY [Roseibacterium persicicum]NKX45893.1 biotin transporter BioY [Roseibacterium persicicum]